MTVESKLYIPLSVDKKAISVVDEQSIIASVNELLALKYGSVYISGAPELVKSIDSILWKVPVFYSTPKTGVKKKVGDFFIDAKTGKIISVPSIESLRHAT